MLMVLGAVSIATLLSYVVYSLYRVAAREQKRLESITKSPLLAFFAELITGAAVTRAFGEQRRVIEVADGRVDDANRALFNLQAAPPPSRRHLIAISLPSHRHITDTSLIGDDTHSSLPQKAPTPRFL